eukprot:14944909-Alexandrium_andersonii.AAC.1
MAVSFRKIRLKWLRSKTPHVAQQNSCFNEAQSFAFCRKRARACAPLRPFLGIPEGSSRGRDSTSGFRGESEAQR